MCSRPRWWAKQRWSPPSPGGVGLRPDQVDPGAVPVVVDGLLDPVAVGVELGADVGQRVPLRRVLQREGDHVVRPHVDVLGVPPALHLAHVDVVEGVGVALHVLGRGEDRRVPALVERRAAGIVERQAQAEADAGLDLADALEHLLRGEQVDAAELVVLAPVAPRRAGRALLPPLRHGPSPSGRGTPRPCCRRCLYRPVGLHSWAQGTACAPARSSRTCVSAQEGHNHDREATRRLRRRAHPRAHRPLRHPPAQAPAGPWRLGGRLRDRAAGRGRGPRSSGACTRPGSRGGRSPGTARPAGGCPRATPR